MRRGSLLFLALAAVAAAICVRLGFWQLGRLADRRAANHLVATRLDSAVVPLAGLPADTALARYRRVVVEGTYDPAHEIVLAGRSRNGSPGVNLLTPLRIAGSDTAVLVNRGWVYSPDARVVERERWGEPVGARVEGFVLTFLDATGGPALLEDHPRTVRWLDPVTADSLLPYPMAPYLVVATIEPDSAAASPARLAPPPLDEGQHLSYAVQWFTFATVALGGAGLVLVRGGGRAPGAAPGGPTVPPPPPLPTRGGPTAAPRPSSRARAGSPSAR